MLNLLWLEDFRALASTGNFSRAAEQRHMTQPAFSRRIRALEDWLGAELFDRSTQPVQLTEVGVWFGNVADDLLARSARLPAEARRVADAHAAVLRIASTHALSFTFLPAWLRGLEARAPLGPIQLVSDVLQRGEQAMRRQQVQFLLSHAHPGVPGELDAGPWRWACVGQDELLPVSAPDDRGGPLHVFPAADRQKLPLLRYTPESGLGRIIAAVIDRQHAVQPGTVAFTADLASVLRTLALDGRGLAWLPRSLIADDLAASRLVPAGDTAHHVPLDIRLYRPDEALPAAAEAFWQAAAI
ncbi:MAG: LysR family transcriptional regulator [Lautropia sp.]|nr:LysR family transcriptional regulator [Lautropia sp.]